MLINTGYGEKQSIFKIIDGIRVISVADIIRAQTENACVCVRDELKHAPRHNIISRHLCNTVIWIL